jgi:hypothetical protein
MVKVKIGLNDTSIPCESYKWGDSGIVLYNAEHAGSIWGRVSVFNTSATIWVFEDETKLVEESVEEPMEEPEEKPW